MRCVCPATAARTSDGALISCMFTARFEGNRRAQIRAPSKHERQPPRAVQRALSHRRSPRYEQGKGKAKRAVEQHRAVQGDPWRVGGVDGLVKPQDPFGCRTMHGLPAALDRLFLRGKDAIFACGLGNATHCCHGRLSFAELSAYPLRFRLEFSFSTPPSRNPGPSDSRESGTPVVVRGRSGESFGTQSSGGTGPHRARHLNRRCDLPPRKSREWVD